jgi:hypothetical protein
LPRYTPAKKYQVLEETEVLENISLPETLKEALPGQL